MNEYTECPKCGNDSIKLSTNEAWGVDYSVKTGKCLKKTYLECTAWHYVCKCGWISESFTQ
ncbi:hypothetical protein [Bacillus velezensis]|uniref:hypothetical protein n=1 Tax=Bacillus velezensis TaxID=492670 RepID=UPI003896C587